MCATQSSTFSIIDNCFVYKFDSFWTKKRTFRWGEFQEERNNILNETKSIFSSSYFNSENVNLIICCLSNQIFGIRTCRSSYLIKIYWHRRHKSNILCNGHEFHYLNWKYSTFDCTTIIKIDWHSFLSILMSPVWYEHTCTFVIWNLNEINLLVFTSIIHAFQFANISTKNIYKHVCVTHYTIRPVQFQWRKIFFFSLACACGGIFHQKCKTHCWKKVKKNFIKTPEKPIFHGLFTHFNWR